MGLRGYIFKRVIYSFILILLVITLNYIIFYLMPGDPVGLFTQGLRGYGEKEKAELIKALKEQLGLADPPHIQFLKYVRNMFTWSFGNSIYTRRSVANEMMYRLPWTILLMGGSTAFAAVIGIVLGVQVAHRRGGKFDSSMVLTSLLFYSLPTFWMGMIFITVFYLDLGWFAHAHAHPLEWNLSGWPQALTISSGSSPQTLNIFLGFNPQEALRLLNGLLFHWTLPLLTLTLFQYGGYLLLTRATMLDALTDDYIITAKAKGVKERTILYKHALKNASLPLITSVALSFGFMLSGAIITETVYSWPGLGGWIWNAIQQKDYYVLQAIFYIIALCVIAANFISDLLYGVIDPRVKYG